MPSNDRRGKNIDGGWGWMVLLGAFISYFIADGWSYSFGILFPEIVDYFSASKGTAALIPTLLYGIPMLISPIACILVNIFSYRSVGMIGGFFVGLSLLIASFASSVTFLCLSIGILCSIGLAMVYISSIIAITCYFEKRRGIATALSLTGSGLGAFAFPPLMYALMDWYSWRGMLLITSGIGFTAMPACALYKELSSGKEESDKSLREPENDVDTREDYIEELVIVINPSTSSNDNPVLEETKFLSMEAEGLMHSDYGATGHSIEAGPTHRVSVDEIVDGQGKKHEDMSVKTTDDIERRSSVDLQNRSIVSNQDTNGIVEATVSENISGKPPQQGAQSRQQKTFREKTVDVMRELRSLPSVMFNHKLLRKSTFLIFCAANFVLFLWVSMPFVYIADRAIELDIAADRASFLLSIMAFGRTVGQLVAGAVGDLKRVNVNLLYAAGVIACGVVTLLVPLCMTYDTMCAYAAAFGIFVSVTNVLPMMCLVEVLGLQQATSAFGLLLLVQGLGILLGTPVAGWLFDATGSYDTSFYIAGAMILLPGCVLVPLPLMLILKKAKE